MVGDSVVGVVVAKSVVAVEMADVVLLIVVAAAATVAVGEHSVVVKVAKFDD